MNYSSILLNPLHWFLGILLYSCAPQSQPKGQIDHANVATVVELLDQNENAVVLDVRTPEEFTAGHIEGAININIYDDDFPEKVAKLDRDKTYVVHCAANVENGRSAKSLDIMDGLGFTSLISMDGGFAAWQQDSLPLAK
ncbi:MAG: rhodanese-like domain-containing protein [Bacteroidota bacterium]